MKKKYVSPDMEIVLFEAEDVITASGVGDNEEPWNIDVPEEI
ncbi:MAG: hypothetical protein Q4C48_06390 [Lachnospiraceae bacterium]|nr:hypothetical protein [Lachnospiraceae bacterium]